MTNGAGYSKGQEKKKEASQQRKDVRGEGRWYKFSPSASGTGKYKDSNIGKGKVLYNTGPEGDSKLIPRGAATTQRMRYDLGTEVASKRRQKKSTRGS